MAPVGHTCEQSLHSGRQYPRSYDISGCIRFIRLVEGRNTWLEQADTHNWQAVQCAAMFRALNEPGEINAKIGDIVLVEGTGLNEEMMQTLMALDEFRGRDFTGKEINEIKEAFGGFVLEQIVKHAGSPVGNYLYEAYQNKLSENQQTEARKTLGIG